MVGVINLNFSACTSFKLRPLPKLRSKGIKCSHIKSETSTAGIGAADPPSCDSNTRNRIKYGASVYLFVGHLLAYASRKLWNKLIKSAWKKHGWICVVTNNISLFSPLRRLCCSVLFIVSPFPRTWSHQVNVLAFCVPQKWCQISSVLRYSAECVCVFIQIVPLFCRARCHRKTCRIRLAHDDDG